MQIEINVEYPGGAKLHMIVPLVEPINVNVPAAVDEPVVEPIQEPIQETSQPIQEPVIDDGQTQNLYTIQFDCEAGVSYVPPAKLVKDFMLAFGEQTVLDEFLKAKAWLSANPKQRKTPRGMGRFLNAWLCRSEGRKRIAIKQSTRTGSLLDNGTQTSQGW